MKAKLTLRVDEKLIRVAKRRAKKLRKSVSQMVAEYFAVLEGGADRDRPSLTPLVRSLKGVLRGAGVSERDYRRHLEEKHL